MIIPLFRRSKDAQVVPYVCGMKDGAGNKRFALPVVLFGCPDAFEAELTASPYRQPYLSLALAWSEPKESLSLEVIKKVAAETVSLFTGNQSTNNFGVLTVLHEGKKTYDVHIVILKCHRPSGKQFRLFCGTEDEWEALHAFRRRTNLSHDWSDPDDPWRRGMNAVVPRWISDERKAEFREIDAWALGWVEAGAVACREELIELIKETGCSVEAHHNYIDVFTLQSANKPIRFRGGKFRASANYDEIRTRLHAPRERCPEASKREIAKLDKRLSALRSDREKELGRRFDSDGFRYPTRIARLLEKSRGSTIQYGGNHGSGKSPGFTPELTSPIVPATSQPASGTQTNPASALDNYDGLLRSGVTSVDGVSDSENGGKQVSRKYGSENPQRIPETADPKTDDLAAGGGLRTSDLPEVGPISDEEWSNRCENPITEHPAVSEAPVGEGSSMDRALPKTGGEMTPELSSPEVLVAGFLRLLADLRRSPTAKQIQEEPEPEVLQCRPLPKPAGLGGLEL